MKFWPQTAALEKLALLVALSASFATVIWLVGVTFTPAPSAPQALPHRQHRPAPLAQLPGGGRHLLPERRLVALYGNPETPLLGVLGEQPAEPAMDRAIQLAAQYQPLSHEKVLPTVEIIATVASASATENGDFSRETPPPVLRPWIDAAKRKGVYVILDLQPGRTDFLTQAKQHEDLLREPHVGLALDPEWRLKPHEQHLNQIGSVNIDEVNTTSDWLATLTKTYRLPQKVFLLHQFKLSMIEGRERLKTDRPELAYIIQMDGQGGQGGKLDTWNVIRQNAPANTYFGWKNFYDEDQPMLAPEQTMQLQPQPWYISYQ